MRHNGDTAVGFLERASQLLKPRGRCGLIVPKPLTYSFAWRHVREMLQGRVEQLVDVSRAWPDVRLEQVMVIYGQQTRARSYRAAWLNGHGFGQPVRLSWRWAKRFGTLPCALDRGELRLLDELQWDDVTVGELVKTWRGLPLQRRLAPKGDLPVVGGRDLQRWSIRSASGYLSTADAAVHREAFRLPKLLFQNIIAHVNRPQPHILLIGAHDTQGTITLDTVNNLTPRAPGLPLEGLLALLHSRLINWFVYSVVYNKAIRTMHFDQYFLNKIPLPPKYEKLLAHLAALATVVAPDLGAIDRAVDAAYGLPARLPACVLAADR
jgi:hypothetical protein